AAGPAAAVPPFTLSMIDSASFAAQQYAVTFLIDRVLVSGQPMVWGGVKKALKTSTMIDAVLSLGTGTPFLGKFNVRRPCRVGVLSGESGRHAIQATARAVCAAKRINLAEANVFWEFKLPQPSRVEHLAELG